MGSALGCILPWIAVRPYSTDWTPEKDIYDSVLVATLGCVKIKASIGFQEREGDGEEEEYHRPSSSAKKIEEEEDSMSVKRAIVESGAIGLLSQLLEDSSSEVRAEAARALANLSSSSFEEKAAIASSADSTSSRQTMQVNVHPFFLFIPAVVMFVLQNTLLLAWELSLDPANMLGGTNQHPIYSELLVTIKCSMAMLWLLMTLKELLIALNGMHISLNPYTLRLYLPKGSKDPLADPDLHRLCSFGFKWLLCLCAKTMQFMVAFLCPRMGLNIIVQANRVEDVVFNGLVLGFINDLDEVAFTFVSTLIDIDIRAYEAYKVDEERILSARNAVERSLSFCRQTAPMEETRVGLRDALGVMISVVQGSRELLIFGSIFGLYLYQALDVLLAVETGVLPAVRDLCVLIRVHQSTISPNDYPQGDFIDRARDHLWSFFVFKILDGATPFVDLPHQLHRIAQVQFDDADDTNFKERCLEAMDETIDDRNYERRYSKLSPTEVAFLAKKHPLAVTGIGALLLGIFVMPRLVLCMIDWKWRRSAEELWMWSRAMTSRRALSNLRYDGLGSRSEEDPDKEQQRLLVANERWPLPDDPDADAL